MSTTKIDATRVKEILTRVAGERPEHRDRRATTGTLTPRYAEHGCPACLVGEILFRLGVKISVLKEMHETQLRHLRHPVQRKFTPNAWMMLVAIQWCNDRNQTWEQARAGVLGEENAWFPWWLKDRPWMKEIDG